MHSVSFSLSHGTAEKQTKQIKKKPYYFNMIRVNFIVPAEQDVYRCFCKSQEEFTCIFSYKH